MIRLFFSLILFCITLINTNGNESNAIVWKNINFYDLSVSAPDTLLLNVDNDTLKEKNSHAGANSADNLQTIFFHEQMPEFPGGQKAMAEFIKKNNKYPATPAEKLGRATVIVQFIIRSTGKIDGIKIIRGDNPILNAETIRILKLMPDFIPGRQNGKPVDVYYTLPFRFGEVEEVK